MVIPTTIVPGERRYLGIGLETTFGGEVGGDRYFDILRNSLDTPSDQGILYQGVSSRVPALAIPGAYVPQGDMELGVGPKNFGMLLKAGLGGWTTKGTPDVASTTLAAAASKGDTSITVDSETGFTVGDQVQLEADAEDPEVVEISALDLGAGPTYTWTLVKAVQKAHVLGKALQEVVAPFTHVFFPIGARNLPSLTARVGKQVFEHVFLGTTINQMSFSVERNQFLTARVSLIAQKDKKVALDTSAKSLEPTVYTGRDITVFQWETDVPTETDLILYAESFTVDLNNNIDGDAGVRFGSRFPKEFEVQGFDLSVSFVLAFQSTEEYERFWGGVTEPTEGPLMTERLVVVFARGTDSLTFWFPRAYVSAAPAEMSGRDRITQNVSVQPIYDPSWYNAVKIDMVNDVDRY